MKKLARNIDIEQISTSDIKSSQSSNNVNHSDNTKVNQNSGSD